MSSLGRILAAIVLAALMLFPGVELLRFVMTEVLGLYADMTQTDCLLFFVIVLLTAMILQRAGDARPKRNRSSDGAGLRLAGPKDPTKRRRSTRETSGRTRSREPSPSRRRSTRDDR